MLPNKASRHPTASHPAPRRDHAAVPCPAVARRRLRLLSPDAWHHGHWLPHHGRDALARGHGACSPSTTLPSLAAWLAALPSTAWPSMAFHGLPSHGHPSYPVQVPSCRFGIANACAAFSLRRGDTPFGNVVVLRLIVAPLWCARICPSCPHPALAAGHSGRSARSDLSGLWPLCPLWPLRPLRPWLAMCIPAKHHTRCSAGRA